MFHQLIGRELKCFHHLLYHINIDAKNKNRKKMLRQAKQALMLASRVMANADSFVPVLLLAEEDVEKCSQEKFIDILANLEELCANRSIEERPKYIEMIYHRMLNILSRKVPISEDRINLTIKEFVKFHPSMSILTLDDLKTLGLEMEKRSILIHFDQSGSMATAGFSPLVQTISQISTKLQNEGRNVQFSLFGGRTQEGVHQNIGNRLLTLNEFIQGDYKPTGGTAFCPSFERTKEYSQSYDGIIISDGEFTDDISKLAFQDQCKTVFFIAPPWSPVGVEEKHAKVISSSVHSNVPYIGISSKDYAKLDQILEKYLSEHHSFAHLVGFVTIGNNVIPRNLLAPTEMMKIFNQCHSQGEEILQILTKKYFGVFRYVEETAKLNFERCLKGNEFQSLMSLITPLIKLSSAHLETSLSSRQLYGYLTKILDDFAHEKQRLIGKLMNDEKSRMEINKLWDSAMSFDERPFIIEKNQEKFGASVACLHFQFDHLNCSNEFISNAFKQLKILNTPEDFDQLSFILDLLSSCKLIEQSSTKTPDQLNIPIWRKSDGTIELLSLFRLFPTCLQQYQHWKKLPLDSSWTLQPLAAIRLAWVMEASERIFPEFIQNALPTLVVSNKTLIDLDLDENRTGFWMKILRQLAPKISLPEESLRSIDQILSVHVVKGFLHRLTDHSITYEKQIYENVSPFIDTDQAKAWCVLIDRYGNRLDASTGQSIKPSPFVKDPATVHNYYLQNVRMHGALVRPRYLTLLDYPQLEEGTIELYQTSMKKDSDILRDQLMGMYSSDQINAHIHTIRDRLKSIPTVLWGSHREIAETVRTAKAACQGALIPTEKVTINVPRTIAVEYLISHCEQSFIAGALRGFNEYSRVSKESAFVGVKELDYAIESGQNTTTIPAFETKSFLHFDKPGVQEYLDKLNKQLLRSLRSISQPPQFTSLNTRIQQIKSTNSSDEIIGMSDLESIPERPITTNSIKTPNRVIFDQNLFTCPITLDIMDNPATTTPCGHMFEMDSIVSYTKKAGKICPICRAVITTITPNYAFKSVIEAWSMQQTD